MRLARFGPAGDEIPALVTETDVYDLRTLTPDIDGNFLARGGLQLIADAVATGQLPRLYLDPTTRIAAPVARPAAVLCIGMNYAEHATESGSAPPPQPVLFYKHPNTVVGPNDDVAIPHGSKKTDWEVELGVVVGKRASYLASPDSSMRHVAGFVVANDLSEREWQLELSGGQWSKGKSAPGFTPIGPWLVTPEELDHSALRLQSFVNGSPRQDSTTADLIFDVEFLIWHLSQYLTLEPGDLVLTGTPAGVALSGRFPFLRPGDVVEVKIEGLGAQRQRFVEP